MEQFVLLRRNDAVGTSDGFWTRWRTEYRGNEPRVAHQTLWKQERNAVGYFSLVFREFLSFIFGIIDPNLLRCSFSADTMQANR